MSSSIYPSVIEATMSSQEQFEFTEVPSPDSLFNSLTVMSDATSTQLSFPAEFHLKSSYVTDFQTSPSEVTSSDLFSPTFLLDMWPPSSETTSSSEVSSSEVTSETSDTDAVSVSVSRPQKEKSNLLKYPPCVVCSGIASGLHYGCYTCEACKNFFRRYLIRSKGFECKKQDTCQILNRSRGNCSGCRLNKCLRVGMSKEKSKIGRYTHAQRTETIKEVNKLEGKHFEDEINAKNKNNRCNATQSPTITLKLETDDFCEADQIYETAIEVAEERPSEGFEFELIGTLVEAMDAIEHFGKRGSTPEGVMEIITEHYEKYLAKVKLFGPLKAIPKEEYFTLLKMYNIDLDGRWNLFKQEANNCGHIVQRYNEFSQKIPGFSHLCPKTQENLLKFGHCDFFIILLHRGYVDEYSIFLEMNGVPSHVEEAADKIFSRELIELQCDIYLRWQKLELTKEEMALLISMSIVCPDRCDLEDPDVVENIHSHLVDLLIRQLQKTHGSNANKRFSKFINCLMFNRIGSEKYFKEYKEMSQNEMVTNTAPAFPDLCPDL